MPNNALTQYHCRRYIFYVSVIYWHFSSAYAVRLLQNKYECTIDQELPAEWNDVMVAILKLWRQIENPTLSTDAYLLEKYSY